MEGMFGTTLAQLARKLPRSGFVLGGDWNQNLTGGWEYVGSSGAREHLERTLNHWNLQVPTAGFAHRLPGSHSIDHIAVPSGWTVQQALRIEATGLSDHDAYIVEVCSGTTFRQTPS